MLKTIKKLLKDNAIFIAIFITVSIAIGSLVKPDLITLKSISVSDKTYHFIAYFFLMFSWLYAFLKNEKFQKNIKYLILGCLIFGIVIEILQGTITSYRTTSYLDILANSVGIGLAVLIFHFFEKKIQLF
ncbi:MAG: VanZ family protein [Flavobacteriaceae bacterium]|jgi:VanZ family protein|tara:strand:+ start:6042 stop:6431 length:390 start_codon:yes stop_codon:yes gene_type:complete